MEFFLLISFWQHIHFYTNIQISSKILISLLAYCVIHMNECTILYVNQLPEIQLTHCLFSHLNFY